MEENEKQIESFYNNLHMHEEQNQYINRKFLAVFAVLRIFPITQ